MMGEVGAAERNGEEEAQRRGLPIHLRWLRTLLDLRKLEAADVVAGRSVGRAAEKSGKSQLVSATLATGSASARSALPRERVRSMALNRHWTSANAPPGCLAL